MKGTKVQYSPLAKYLYEIRMKRGYEHITQAVEAMYPDLKVERENLPKEEREHSPFDYKVTLLSRYEYATIPVDPTQDDLFKKLAATYKIPMEKIVAVCNESRETRRYWAPKRKKKGEQTKSSQKTTTRRIEISPRKALEALIKKYKIEGQSPSNIASKLNNHKQEFIDALKALV